MVRRVVPGPTRPVVIAPARTRGRHCDRDQKADGPLVAADWGLEIPAAPQRWDARGHASARPLEETDDGKGMNLLLLIVLGVAPWLVIVALGCALVSW